MDIPTSYIERLERKQGYQEGFEDGLKASYYCRSCDLVNECAYGNKLVLICPYSVYKNTPVV
jgi:hypothetical protein